MKALLSLVIIAAGALTVPFLVSDSSAEGPQASGFLIDFEEWDATWTAMDMTANSDPYRALETACDAQNFDHVVEDGIVKEINGVSADDTHTWSLWTISRNSTTWVKESNPKNVDLSKYVIAGWAYRDDKGTPTIAVDATGRSIYGFKTAQRVITLSPALTEIAGAIRAVETLVGTDSYSVYPDSVVSGHNSGRIKIVGSFLNPSFERVVTQQPDMVFCDGALFSHYLISDRLRNMNVNTMVMYGGESIQAILSNIYIMGAVIGYEIRSLEVIRSIEMAVNDLITTLYSHSGAVEKSVMLSLSADKSPWVTGTGTYIHDLSTAVLGKNVFSTQFEWVQINSEMIPATNPSAIIIYSAEYNATQQEYDSMMNSLSAEWRATDAYRNGNIYLVCGTAGDMAMNPSPRFAQLMEVTARILHPDVFSDTVMPKFIGSDYRELLTFTKELDFNN